MNVFTVMKLTEIVSSTNLRTAHQVEVIKALVAAQRLGIVADIPAGDVAQRTALELAQAKL